MDQNHKAPTLWAYLYVNWLAPDRWVLWARSSFGDCMPLRNTSMIAESFFAVLKLEDCLGKTRARLDDVGYVLNTCVVPQYLRKFTMTVGLQFGGRPPVTGLASWRRDLRTMLLAYGRMNIRPCNDVWIQDPASGTCNCPAFLRSPHFFCKHIYKMYSLNGTKWDKFLYDSIRLRHPPFWKSPSLRQPSQEFFHLPSSSSTTAYESEDEEELLERLEDGWMSGASLSETDSRRARAQATQEAEEAEEALGVAEAGTSVLDSIAEAERMRREAGEEGEELLREVETLLKRVRIQVAQKDHRHIQELWEAIGARAEELNTDMAEQERAVTSNTTDTNTQREKRRGKGQWHLKFYDAMKAVASMKNGEPGSSADVN
ncbi:hypothetical protein B9479_000244 [Cryptococcus floricola]|uniref:SWIM-type domain-containing protein n=1 Tax=Cryptococcus floricola TaxID=2591691 RepID=A0A5D3B7A3_9TREE|nr:hypothetical protein B9479_000244 [Cryptococcus floricola]